MALSAGTRLGPYEIVAPLGAGGMGEVYRAKDTRLGREVAVKVLPAEVANDPDRLHRFEQEARATSAIQHANLLTLFDIGNEGGVAFLVTELLVGETLRDVMQHGPVPARRAIEIAVQVARGLAAAHEAGIVHRDLKPENLFVTKDGNAKILDFGLAKVEPSELAGKNLQEASTVLETRAGTVLGTVGYMAPEQVRGERADARSDLFSLGVVLHELLVGANPFRRGSVIESLNAILKEEPAELDAGAGATTPALARIVARLLEKDPDRRFRSAADLAFALEGLSNATSGAAPRLEGRSQRAPGAAFRLAAGALFALVLATAAYWVGRRQGTTPTTSSVRFELAPPEGTVFLANTLENVPFAVSPDGRTIAFVGIDRSSLRTQGFRIWLRRLDESEPRPLAGSEGATSLAWSPDGRSLAFLAGGRLMRLALDGGAPVPICDVAPGIGHAASWGAGGEILFASVNGEAIRRVPASGGSPETVVSIDPAAGIARVLWPTWLPDGRGFLYQQRSTDSKAAVMLVEGDGPAREVAPIASRVELLAPDWLLFVRDGALLAQRLDRSRGRLVGTAVSVAPTVRYFYSSAWAGFAASPTGSAVYLTGGNQSRLLWIGRDGREEGSVGSPGDYLHAEISPDGRSVLADRTQPELGTYDLWRIDLERGVESRLTTSPNADFSGVWLPDGKRIVYSTVTARAPNLRLRDLISGRDEVLLPSDSFQRATDVSRDGRLLAMVERSGDGRFHASTVPLDGARTAVDLFHPDAGEDEVKFSPDGRWVAWISDLTGSAEAYVAPLSSPNDSVRVTLAGAVDLRWSHDGGELFVLSSEGELLSVAVRATPVPRAASPRTLFRLAPGVIWTDFDVAPDDRRFLAVVRERSASTFPASVVVGWRPPDEE